MSIKAALESAINQYKSGNLSESAAEFSALLELHPDNPDAHNLLGVVQGALGQFEDSTNSIKKAIKLKPGTPSFHFNLAQVYKRQYLLDESLAACEEAIKVKPDYLPALREAVIICNYKGDKKKALGFAEAMVKFHPDNHESHNMLGEVYNRLQDFARTEKCYRKAIELNPNHHHAYSNLGNLKHNMNQLDEARALFRKSLEIKPDQPIIKHTLAALEGHTTEKPGEEFVVSLFNFYADNFDEHMKTLNYQVPEIMHRAIMNFLGKDVDSIRIVDLGCGTGKLGKLFEPVASNMIGIDLAPKMLEHSAKLDVYDELVLGDVVEFLKQRDEKIDLILSADTLIYVGALEELFSIATTRLNPGGLFAFSIEEDSGDKYSLHESGRYKHSLKYIEELAKKNNFKTVHNEKVGIRMQFDKPIPGRVIMLQKV